MFQKQKFTFLPKFNSAITYKGECTCMFVCRRQLVEIEIEVEA